MSITLNDQHSQSPDGLEPQAHPSKVQSLPLQGRRGIRQKSANGSVVDRNEFSEAAVQLSSRPLHQVANPIRPAAAESLRAQGLLAELAAACRKEHVLRRRWMPPRLNRRPLKNN
jgi:hypothetical protein